MGLRYEFTVRPPGENVRIAMVVRRGEDIALTASFEGRRIAFTDANILRTWLANPLMTASVIAGIYWEALKMMAKGVAYLGRGETQRAPELRSEALVPADKSN
jgi:DUF1365 family protein